MPLQKPIASTSRPTSSTTKRKPEPSSPPLSKATTLTNLDGKKPASTNPVSHEKGSPSPWKPPAIQGPNRPSAASSKQSPKEAKSTTACSSTHKVTTSTTASTSKTTSTSSSKSQPSQPPQKPTAKTPSSTSTPSLPTVPLPLPLPKTAYTTPLDIHHSTLKTQYHTLPPTQQAAQDAWAKIKLKKLPPCPSGYTWMRVEKGYQCEGGHHLVTDELLAEGRGGVMEKRKRKGLLRGLGRIWRGPVYGK